LLTGSNYNDNDKKIVGGRNGYGAKLANIFSNRFILSCGDQANRKEFNMEWRDNMNTHSEPEIKSYSSKDYTSVTFYPDFKRFGMKHLEDDIYKVMEKRVYDIAGIFPSVNVILNGKEIKLKSFKEYVGMYLWSGDQPKKVRYSDL
jgi:DNA topoisomerase-2